MTRSLFFVVPGPAKSFGTKVTRMGAHHGTRKTKVAETWENAVRAEAVRAFEPEAAVGGSSLLLSGPIAVVFRAEYVLGSSIKSGRKWKSTNPDVDKIERLVLDAMEGTVYANDAEVSIALGSKVVVQKGRPSRTLVYVAEVGGLPYQDRIVEVDPSSSFETVGTADVLLDLVRTAESLFDAVAKKDAFDGTEGRLLDPLPRVEAREDPDPPPRVEMRPKPELPRP